MLFLNFDSGVLLEPSYEIMYLIIAMNVII